jgi:hypothetical protein
MAAGRVREIQEKRGRNSGEKLYVEKKNKVRKSGSSWPDLNLLSQKM